MPTTASFASFVATYPTTPVTSGGIGNPNSAVTVTATSDDGLIVPGDAVTFSTLFSFNIGQANITDSSGFYLGTVTFAGETGYVFSNTDSVATSPGFVVAFDTSYTPAIFSAVDFHSIPSVLGTDPACFAQGTMLATPSGSIAIEDLAPGAVLKTADGLDAPVKWVGKRTLATAFVPGPSPLVRIAKGAFGNHADLLVTADHGLIVDGLIVNAGALVNGGSVDWVPRTDLPGRITVYHVEMEAHVALLANGVPAESFVDYTSRDAFENAGGLSDPRHCIPEMPLPRVASARLVPASIRAALSLAPDRAA